MSILNLSHEKTQKSSSKYRNSLGKVPRNQKIKLNQSLRYSTPSVAPSSPSIENLYVSFQETLDKLKNNYRQKYKQKNKRSITIDGKPKNLNQRHSIHASNLRIKGNPPLMDRKVKNHQLQVTFNMKSFSGMQMAQQSIKTPLKNKRSNTLIQEPFTPVHTRKYQNFSGYNFTTPRHNFLKCVKTSIHMELQARANILKLRKKQRRKFTVENIAEPDLSGWSVADSDDYK